MTYTFFYNRLVLDNFFYLAIYKSLPIYYYVVTYTTFYITGLVYIVYP